MRVQDIKKLMVQHEHHKRGGFPDIGKRHPKAGFRFSIGMAVFENGEIAPWRENLGHDKLTAQYRARAMFDHWLWHMTLHNAGSGFDANPPPVVRAVARNAAFATAATQMRSPSELAERYNAKVAAEDFPLSPGIKLLSVPITINEDAAQLKVSVANQQKHYSTGKASADHAADLTLNSAADAWLTDLWRREAKGDISDSYVARVDVTVRRLKEFGLEVVLHLMKKPELDFLRLSYQNRRTKAGRLRSRGTIDTELGHVRSLFQWLIDSEKWNPCPNWQRWLTPVHRVDENDGDADQERTIETYSIEELSTIYVAATKSCRRWILFGLNFAWGAKEIATARKRHFKVESGERRVARFRHKRKPGSKPVPGRWIAWPETWEMALTHMTRTSDELSDNPKGLAFLSVQRKPLVRYSRSSKGVRRYDVVADAFDDACRLAGIENRGFYAIRRTAVDLVDQIAGERIADLFCQHATKSMTKKCYTNKRWHRLFRALDRLHQRLQPMFNGTGASTRATERPISAESHSLQMKK